MISKQNKCDNIEESFYILNTNYTDCPDCHNDMMDNHKAAAYRIRKENIEKIKEGDKILLYRSSKGIVAIGIAKGELEKKPYPGEKNTKIEEYSKKLDKFKKLKQPLPAAEIKKIIGVSVNYPFTNTMFTVDKESGNKLWEHISKECI